MRLQKVILSAVFILTSCSGNERESTPKELSGFQALSGPYFGQEPPGSEPKLFLPGLITTPTDYERCVVFLDDGRLCVFAQDQIGVVFTREKDGRWTPPQSMPLEPKYYEFDYTPTPNGRAIVFQSIRPIGDGDILEEGNIWTMEWMGDGWTAPTPLSKPPNTDDAFEGYPALTADGTAYFFSSGSESSLPVDIYYSRSTDGQYQEPIALDAPINSAYDEHDPIVAPDESYLMFGSRRPGGFGRDDTYICFRRDDGTWTHPLNIGSKLNSISGDNRINMTTDGQYFFFNSSRDTDYLENEPAGDKWASPSGVYWVDSSFIESHRHTLLNKDCAATLIERKYERDGLAPAIGALKDLYANRQDDYYFSYYELLQICEQMIRGGDVGDAEKFYEVLLETLPSEYRVKRGYAMVLTMNGLPSQGLTLLADTMAPNPKELMINTYWVGHDLIRYKKREDALKVMKVNAMKHPDAYLAHLGLAQAYEANGDTENAIESCKKALELKPDYKNAVSLLKSLES